MNLLTSRRGCKAISRLGERIVFGCNFVSVYLLLFSVASAAPSITSTAGSTAMQIAPAHTKSISPGRPVDNAHFVSVSHTDDLPKSDLATNSLSGKPLTAASEAQITQNAASGQSGDVQSPRYQDDVLQQNQQLQRTVYWLSSIVIGLVVVMSYFLYQKVVNTNRLLIEANRKLELQATRDPLTGLMNRQAFHDSMKVRMQKIERRISDQNQPPHALVLLDIDHFKYINDRFGHVTGDQVLIEVTARLAQIMRDNDKLTRWSGEEFLIFLNNISTENLERVVRRILAVVGGAPIKVEQLTLSLTVSIGYISLMPGNDSEVDEHWEKSMKLADASLYKAKIGGRNQAIGIQQHSINLEELDAMLTIDLEELEQERKIVAKTILGPTIEKKLLSAVG